MLAGIIADDLTGACDAAVHFRAAGLRTEVNLSLCVPGADIVAYSTDSRDVGPEEVRRRIEAVAALVRPDIVFKKIDSVLRGRPGLEIAVALEAFGCDVAVIAPAYPEMGRVVRGGVLEGPAPIVVADRLREDGLELARCRVLDAATNADLDGIAGRDFGGRVLWCGSGGLALALAGRLRGGSERPVTPPRGPVTFCIGSTHSVTVEQVRWFRPRSVTVTARNRVVSIDRNGTTAEEIRALLAGPPPAALFACGGDTATMILAALGAESIVLEGEVVRGVPWGTMRGGIMDGVAVVTKSGGFGAPDALERVASFFN
jgi:uncharacterized protein YgbK (DUF1537 family)